ncbi:hypothetical protein GCM10009078_00420 [Cupriavidus gilardii]
MKPIGTKRRPARSGWRPRRASAAPWPDPAEPAQIAQSGDKSGATRSQITPNGQGSRALPDTQIVTFSGTT